MMEYYALVNENGKVRPGGCCHYCCYVVLKMSYDNWKTLCGM
jgi:streptolysin S family bacteriocin protoxin